MCRKGWRVHIAIALTTAPLSISSSQSKIPFHRLIEFLVDKTQYIHQSRVPLGILFIRSLVQKEYSPILLAIMDLIRQHQFRQHLTNMRETTTTAGHT